MIIRERDNVFTPAGYLERFTPMQAAHLRFEPELPGELRREKLGKQIVIEGLDLGEIGLG